MPSKRSSGRWTCSIAIGLPSAVRTRSSRKQLSPGLTSSAAARKPSAATTSLEVTVEPGTCPRASMSSVKEVRAPACAIRGSATKVPRPCSRYTEPSVVSRSISLRTVIRASP